MDVSHREEGVERMLRVKESRPAKTFKVRGLKAKTPYLLSFVRLPAIDCYTLASNQRPQFTWHRRHCGSLVKVATCCPRVWIVS